MKIRCNVCFGSGYVKKEQGICKVCKEKVCFQCKFICRSKGLLNQSYETCHQCDGNGEINKESTNKNILKKK